MVDTRDLKSLAFGRAGSSPAAATNIGGKTMYRLWSEWDIGERNVIFANKEVAMNWLRNNSAVLEIAKEDRTDVDTCIASCFADGYFHLEALEIVK